MGPLNKTFPSNQVGTNRLDLSCDGAFPQELDIDDLNALVEFAWWNNNWAHNVGFGNDKEGGKDICMGFWKIKKGSYLHWNSQQQIDFVHAAVEVNCSNREDVPEDQAERKMDNQKALLICLATWQLLM